MIVVIIHPDPHEARALALRTKELGPGLVIFTAESPAAAAEILGDLGSGSRIVVKDLDARQAPTAGEPEHRPITRTRGPDKA